MALEVTWHKIGANDNMPGDPIKSETITLSVTSTQSAVAPDGADVVRLQATEICRYAKGTNPTATAAAGTSGHYLAAGAEVWLPARALLSIIAGIQAT